MDLTVDHHSDDERHFLPKLVLLSISTKPTALLMSLARPGSVNPGRPSPVSPTAAPPCRRPSPPSIAPALQLQTSPSPLPSLPATTLSAINGVDSPRCNLPVHATPANCPLHVGDNVGSVSQPTPTTDVVCIDGAILVTVPP
ncbi:hypothetical protein ACLOJK_034756 [Asimina triloba]